MRNLLCALVLVLSLSSLRAESLEISGTMMAITPDTTYAKYKWSFRVILEGDAWQITCMPMQRTPGDALSTVIASDGNDFYSLLEFEKVDSPTAIERLRFRGNVIAKPFPEVCNLPEKFLWLAYDSSHYFGNNTNGLLPNILKLDFRKAPLLPYKASFTKGTQRFLEYLDIYTDGISLTNNVEDKRTIEYRVQDYFVTNGFNIPTVFTVAGFTASDDQHDKRRPGYVYEVHVTNNAFVSSPTTFQPVIGGPAWITDHRFTCKTTRSAIRYPEEGKKWLSGKESPTSEEVIKRSGYNVFPDEK